MSSGKVSRGLTLQATTDTLGVSSQSQCEVNLFYKRSSSLSRAQHSYQSEHALTSPLSLQTIKTLDWKTLIIQII